ncbi:DNA replication/repair protein RecF [Ectothiorhodospira lacustris]|uniref:DNA replication/repair protein RecF n=1 Tax=Ectothiorhodospira lacustris TaxID=2899127 RepID=UPI001EE7F3B1|nr:DNA replication/repair protein RecF [Ectothiorhodospira lacustris]MCG5499380.1 DNA replication/repair protein RecF [Ectothiorhodospira lacustris]MCG5509269.1 DNA replication/repair protein RecF [Ectothiorhodospira lacustris]MCG5521059.1 DNA replication/repair protein RecF [Ectothiorhodospira lacustris]
MGLTRLDIFNLRPFEKSRLEPCAGLNLVVGENASGKTSLLEAVHVLATGRSFRTQRIEPVIRKGARDLMVTGRLRLDGRQVSLGIRKGGGKTLARINGKSVRSQSELAQALPLQVIHPDSHELLSGSPTERRGFLDWGIFYQSPEAMGHWQNYRRALIQRNEALRRGLNDKALDVWEALLAQSGEAMDRARLSYLDTLLRHVRDLEALLPGNEGVDLVYRRGWREGVDLRTLLQTARPREREMGYTLSGPHRADVVFRCGDVLLAEGASRGQQKSAVLLLRLAQVAAFRGVTGRSAVVMVDDLPSELDESHRAAVLALLQGLDCQVFVTAIDARQIDARAWSSLRMFHVEQGRLRDLN